MEVVVRLPPHQDLGQEVALHDLVVIQGLVLRAPVQDQGLIHTQDLPNKVQGRGGLVFVLWSGLNVLHDRIIYAVTQFDHKFDAFRDGLPMQLASLIINLMHLGMGCQSFFPCEYAKRGNELCEDLISKFSWRSIHLSRDGASMFLFYHSEY